GTALLPQARHILRLRLADTGAELPGSPVVIERPLADTALSSPVSLSEELFAEHLDRFVDGSPATDAPATVAADRANGAVFPRDGGTRSMPMPESAPELQSNIDSAGWTGIKGWIWDPQDPRKRIALDLLDGDTRLA